jgi:hypothetical protein
MKKTQVCLWKKSLRLFPETSTKFYFHEFHLCTHNFFIAESTYSQSLSCRINPQSFY